jgi:hypothetical protein
MPPALCDMNLVQVLIGMNTRSVKKFWYWKERFPTNPGITGRGAICVILPAVAMHRSAKKAAYYL